jgi:hypothetical protein
VALLGWLVGCHERRKTETPQVIRMKIDDLINDAK